jgi:UDP:flavonoid glycosyltransferase YjiC (YdhE family)
MHNTKRILFVALGSLGDVNPYVALACEVAAQGHRPVVAAAPHFRKHVEGFGVEFAPMRPSEAEIDDTAEFDQKVNDLRTGSEYVIRGLILPHLRESYDDLLAAAGDDLDLLVASPLGFATPLVSERLGVPWVSTALAPLTFFSAHDASLLGPAPWFYALRHLGPRAYGWLMARALETTHSWSEPIRRVRAELGLRPPEGEPLGRGQYSPLGTLALFSPVIGAPQPDWPVHTVQTGFPFMPPGAGEALVLPPAIEEFLGVGDPPLVFTLGSTAVMDPRAFFAESRAAARALGRRALLIGADGSLDDLPQVLTAPYAPYAALFPHAAAIVHQGGIGTTAEALRAGKPMLVVPFAHDQPDNARRVVRAGVGRTVARAAYAARRVTGELEKLLGVESMARAAVVGHQVRQEEGTRRAVEVLVGKAG